jgi:hypothetical protein
MLEKFIYELKPYGAFALGAIGLFAARESGLAFTSGLTLIICSILILNARFKYRGYFSHSKR